MFLRCPAKSPKARVPCSRVEGSFRLFSPTETNSQNTFSLTERTSLRVGYRCVAGLDGITDLKASQEILKELKKAQFTVLREARSSDAIAATRLQTTSTRVQNSTLSKSPYGSKRVAAFRRGILFFPVGVEMARINADDDWWVDTLKRRAALIKRIKELPRNEEDEADGKAMRAWKLAQEFWKDGRRLIPEVVWQRAELEPLIECDLAERRDGGIYVRGSSSRHDWLYEKTESASAAGKASVEARKKKYGTAIPKNASNENPNTQPNATEHPVRENPNDRRTTAEHRPNPPAPAPAPAPALLSLSELESNSSPSPRDLLNLWNANRGDLLEAKKLTKKRTSKVLTRLKEEPDPAYWESVIKRLAASDFATGKVKTEKYPNGWKADFAWLFENDEHHVRVSEGRYDNRLAEKPGAQSFAEIYGGRTIEGARQ